ncbi:MAG: urease accessory UreF family protein [Pseudomonadota bacterium]
MPTDPRLLTLAQWLSPAYPVGAFAYSHGLETAITDGAVTDKASLQDWITDILQHGGGYNDALFLAAAYHADDPLPINATARAFAASRERVLETETQGAAFAEITRNVWAIDLPTLCYPVAVGRAARLTDLPLTDTTALFLQAFVGTLASVGQRLIPIGQTDAQRLVHSLAPLCVQLAANTQDGDLDRLSSTAFLSDIAAMRHETQSTRIFRT